MGFWSIRWKRKIMVEKIPDSEAGLCIFFVICGIMDATTKRIDVTLKDVSFINFIENVESSKISIETISHICEIHQILESLED